jgi:glycogen synthase
MRVLQLGPYPPPEGGINRNMLAIREELRTRGDTAPIVATTKSSRIVTEEEVFHPRSPLKLLRLLWSLKRDITHLHIGGQVNGRVLGLAFATAMLSRGRSVLSLHSGGYTETKEGRRASRSSMRGFIFRMFSRVIVVNRKLREVFLSYGFEPERVSVILPYVHRLPDPGIEVPTDLARFAAGHKPFLLTVGLLEPEYDLKMQIEAMAAIIESLPNAGLMIVGSGSTEESLRELIASKSYKDHVYLTGDVPHAITLHLVDRADILLRTTRHDGDAISVREALFLGTQVIATDNGMRPEGVELIAIGDMEALVKAIIRNAEHPKEERSEGSPDRSNIAKVIAIYEEMLGTTN